jgi:aldose 1-epimerase
VTQVSGTQWTISSGGQTATIAEVGGGLRDYQVDGAEIVDGYTGDELCPGAAGQILAPWPNRLRDGAFKADGRGYQVPLTEPSMNNAIHGLVNWVPWWVSEQSEDTVTVEHVLHPQPGYPWRLHLSASYSLGERGLTVRHVVRNLSPDPAPFGLGTHPYVRIPQVPINDCELQLSARHRLLVDSRLLPIGAAKVAGGDFDYSTARKIGTTELNVAFGDPARAEDGTSEVVVTAPDGRWVKVWADSTFGWWQLYTGDQLPPARRRRAIAIEPMTCPPDALRSGRDLVTIAPGGEWAGQWGISHGVR